MIFFICNIKLYKVVSIFTSYYMYYHHDTGTIFAISGRMVGVF